MSFEIEIKAHIPESDVQKMLTNLKEASYAEYLGEIDKKDIYWALPGSEAPYFRTRYEQTGSSSCVLVTSKPLKKKDFSVEYNVENEFTLASDQWDRINKFCKGLNLETIRLKYKTGFHFMVHLDGYDIHCELLNVKYLGWFVESEIVSENDDVDKEAAEKALYALLNKLNVPFDSVEPRGYNKLLKEVGHERG